MLGFDPFAVTLFSVTFCCFIGALLLECWTWLDRRVLFKGYKDLSLLMSVGYILITALTIGSMVFIADFLTHHKF